MLPVNIVDYNITFIQYRQIAKEGILQMMLQMAKSDEYLQQLVASEAIIASTQKKKDSNMVRFSCLKSTY